MTPEERQLLDGLFDRVGGAANAPRDKEAEALINDQVRAKPFAPYLLAQTVIIQEEALKAAASRIQELEGQLKEREAAGGSFLGGLGKTIFGSGEPPRPAQAGPAGPSSVPRAGSPWGAPPPAAAEPPAAAPGAGPWGRSAPPGPWGAPQGGMFGGGGGGGGFLRGAMTTAAGVAGGALLYQGLSSLFSGNHGSSFLADAQGLTGDAAAQAGSLGDQFFGGNSVLGGAQPAAVQGDDASAADEDPGIMDASDDSYDDGGYDDGGDDGGDWA
ncbi:MAG: DUF2076 domain-containing protein [Alsobacter sp.]